MISMSNTRNIIRKQISCGAKNYSKRVFLLKIRILLYANQTHSVNMTRLLWTGHIAPSSPAPEPERFLDKV